MDKIENHQITFENFGLESSFQNGSIILNKSDLSILSFRYLVEFFSVSIKDIIKMMIKLGGRKRVTLLLTGAFLVAGLIFGGFSLVKTKYSADYVGPNVAPTLTISGGNSYKEGDKIALRLNCYDPDENTTFTIDNSNPPAGSSLDRAFRYFLWEPNYDQAGTYHLDFSVSDGTYTTTATFDLEITENGSAPDKGIEAGASDVLILVNQNSPDSITLGQYYAARRGVPVDQIVSLNTTTDESVSSDDYNSQIKEPIKSFLDSHSLKSKVKYIVPTYGVPSQIYLTQTAVDTVRGYRASGLINYSLHPDYAVDSYLADLYDTLPTVGFYYDKTVSNNPYWKGSELYYDFYRTGFHYSASHFLSEFSTYMVTRLDGASLKVSEGLVDKAIYSGKYTGPADNNKAYVYGQAYYNDAQADICGLAEKAGYGCKQADGYPNDDYGYDPASPTKQLSSDLGGPNPLWLVSPGNEYYDIWGNWRPGSIPIHFQSGTSPLTIRDTLGWFQRVTGILLAADATATTGTVNEPLANGLPQPGPFFDFFLNGDGSEVKHYNFAESMYMSTKVIKWTNIFIGDPLYKLPDNPIHDSSAPKIENVAYSCKDNKANVSWSNLTAEDGSPEVSYGSVNYGTTTDYGTELWDETPLVYYGVSKKNYLSQHSFEISDIDCSKEYYFKVSAVDPELNTSNSTFILNKINRPAPVIVINSPSDGTTVLDRSIIMNYTSDGQAKTKTFNNLNLGENTLSVTEANKDDPAVTTTASVKVIYKEPLNLQEDHFSTGWNMISFADLSDAITNKTFLPGTYKIRKYDQASNSYIKGESAEFSLVPGAGYWIKIDNSDKITGLRYAQNQTSATEISVAKGWNLLGNPYQSDLPLSNLVVKYKNGTTKKYADAINNKEVSGYAWSWEASQNKYFFVAINPDKYKTNAHKQTVVNSFRGFWIIVKSDQISSIIMNK